MSYKACAMAIVGALSLLAANQAQAITMAELSAPGANPVVSGDKIFSAFNYSSATLPADQVAVNFVPSQGITFSAGWNTAFNAGIMDSVIGYTITATGGNQISGASLSMAGLVVTGGGVATVGETLKDPTSGNEYKLQVIYDGNGPLPDNTSDSTAINPATTSLVVIKDISVTPIKGNTQSFASVTFVENMFTQTPGSPGTPPEVIPEPASLALLPLALVGLGLRKKFARR